MTIGDFPCRVSWVDTLNLSTWTLQVDWEVRLKEPLPTPPLQGRSQTVCLQKPIGIESPPKGILVGTVRGLSGTIGAQ